MSSVDTEALAASVNLVCLNDALTLCKDSSVHLVACKPPVHEADSIQLMQGGLDALLGFACDIVW